MALTNRPLSQAGLDYLTSTLAAGKTLGTFLRRRVEATMGRVYAMLPADVSTEAAHKFLSGGKLPPAPPSEWLRTDAGIALPVSDTIDSLALQISAALAGHPDAVCIIEDYLARPGDRGLELRPYPVVTLGQEVYYLLTSAHKEAEFVAEALRDASSIPIFVGCLLIDTQSAMEKYKQGGQMNKTSLRNFALQATRIFVGAYDGESFVCWELENDGPSRASVSVYRGP